MNCFTNVCKKSKLKEGLKRWTSQAFWFLSSILTSPKNILTPRSHACFPCRTGGHTHNPRWKNAQGSKPTITSTPMCVLYLATYVQPTSYIAMWIYVRGILRNETVGKHAALYMLYVPGTETFAANGCHYRKRGLQKSESLRAGLRYCCCGLGDNYLMNKLPNPLAKHTSYST